MEKQPIFCRLIPALRTLLAFGSQHAASLAALKKTYTLCGFDQALNRTRSVLRIRPCGQLYEVTRGYFADDQFRVSEQWLATYGWHSNGHLIALGRTTYVIFDPVRKLVVLENFPAEGEDTVEIFHEA